MNQSGIMRSVCAVLFERDDEGACGLDCRIWLERLQEPVRIRVEDQLFWKAYFLCHIVDKVMEGYIETDVGIAAEQYGYSMLLAELQQLTVVVYGLGLASSRTYGVVVDLQYGPGFL